MRVLMLFAERDGGVPEHVRVLARELRRRGVELTVLGPPDTVVRRDLEAAGIPFAGVPIVGAMLAPIRDARVMAGLLRHVRATAPDLVHAHGQKAGVLGRLVAATAGVPGVYSPHALGYRNQRFRDRRTGPLRCMVTLWLERRLGRRSAAIVACSRDELQTAQDDELADPSRLHVVYSGVALDAPGAADGALVRFKGDAVLVGTVTGLREQKDLPTLVRAFAVLERRVDDVRCVIVGNGPLHDVVERDIAEHGLGRTVRLLPFASPVQAYLRALDVFVLSSRWEGLPISVLEAMAAGLPVVATDVNGVPEAVEHGVTGLLVRAGDPEALAQAIGSLAHDETARKRMGRAGQDVARARFGVATMGEAMLRVYTAALGR